MQTLKYLELHKLFICIVDMKVQTDMATHEIFVGKRKTEQMNDIFEESRKYLFSLIIGYNTPVGTPEDGWSDSWE